MPARHPKFRSTMNCPNVLATGACSTPRCQYEHNVSRCEPCGMLFVDHQDFQRHLRTRRHQNLLNTQVFRGTCSLCGIRIQTLDHWKDHLADTVHVANAEMKGLDPATVEFVPDPVSPLVTKCDACNIYVPNRYLESHQASFTHRSRETFSKFKTVVEETEADKNGLEVVGQLDFDVVEPADAKDGVQRLASVKTSLPFCKSQLVEARLTSSLNARETVTGFSVTVQGSRRDISSVRPLNVVVRFKHGMFGRHEDRLELIFEDVQLKKRFLISRPVKANVGNKAELDALKPIAPYVPRIKRERREIERFVEGVAPPSVDAIPFVVNLPYAPIPATLARLLSSAEVAKAQVKQLQKFVLPAQLSTSTYARFFKTLVWTEEYQSDRDLARYDMHNVHLNRNNQFYYLDVPGLAEKRPSVLVGDKIFAQESGNPNNRWFEGHVHFVRQAEIGLRFHTSFDAYTPHARFNIRFRLNRTAVRRQHQALETAFAEERVLFPSLAHSLPLANPPLINFVNKIIVTNKPQTRAIKSIVSQAPGWTPFIVFGPPGTGKTITVVEAMLQILKANPQARILACAPSNSAADLIASRLKKWGLGADQLFRFYAPSRAHNQVPTDLRDNVTVNPNGHFTVPHMVRLRRFQVIVSTCVSSSFAFNIGLPRGHFTHIFIDEAGQATEPEAFIAIKTMADSKTNIVLSGDPHQLGPVLRSPVARTLGLELSYLERLMKMEQYSEEDSETVIKLTKNFRSHDSILRFPNDCFYSGELEQCASPALINAYIGSSILPNRKFPIIFHSVIGEDAREATSPSFFNPEEVLVVKDYVRRLKDGRGMTTRTTDNDIGVISPYHAQCQRLRKTLLSVAEDVKVGSVEEFQGQERKVIIISAVRSNMDFIKFDLRHTLGFVASPRRFNVTVTRAQALLVVIGNPEVLGLDPLWRSFLNYIHSNNGWVGREMSWNPTDDVDYGKRFDIGARAKASFDMNEFVERMEKLTMTELENEAADANMDRPWVVQE